MTGKWGGPVRAIGRGQAARKEASMSGSERQRDAGEALVKKEVITREELDKARAHEKTSGIPWYRQLIQHKKISFSVLDDIFRYEIYPKSVREEHSALGRTLVEMKAISEEQLAEALKEQKRNGRLLGNILLNRGLVTGRTIGIALSRQHNMEFAELEKTPSDREALEVVPENVARRYQIIPIRIESDRLTVLVAHPQVRESLADLSVLLNKRVHAIMTNVTNITEEIKKRYRMPRSKGIGLPSKKETAPPPKPEPATVEKKKKERVKEPNLKKEIVTAIMPEKGAPMIEKEKNGKNRFEEIAEQASGVPVMKLVSTIIEGAVNSGATDIHLDPQDPEMRVRYRIDGVLHDVMSIPQDIEPAVISRVKIMSELDITENRRPQDGHISMDIGDMEYDIRVATLPTYLGERVVLRLLDQSSVLSGIRDLGLEPEDEKRLTKLVEQPYGMILVTGPTGSGKTTTLYAALNQKNVMTDSIVTLEDPVEYQLSGINQVQIDNDIGVTFANTLRAALRQDIDVLLVGEIRDVDTARIAIRAAMTGHLVFSTLHTNDAPEAISTLRNMGIPSYLIASALTAVVGQRLVRKVCDQCKKEYAAPKNLIKAIGLPESTKKLFKGVGCQTCYHTGNKGRTGIFEILEVTPEVRRMIASDAPVEEIAKSGKMKTMADRCRQKVKQGIVAPEEFLRVIRA